MSTATLVLDGALATLTALLYAYVGSITLRRETSDPGSRRAVRLFAVWWFGLAALTLVGTLRTMIVAAGYVDPTLHNAISWITIVPLVMILWGLVSYLAYIYTGSPTVFTASTLFHAGLLVALLYLVWSRPITGVSLGEYAVELDYATELAGPIVGLLVAALLLPALGSALGYATLYFRTDDRSARYRIAMVSGAFLFWFGIAGLATPLKLNELEWWPIASRLIALGATLMVLAAYQPPRWIREAFGIRPAAVRHEADQDRRLRLARATLAKFNGAS